ncbi:putative aromatic ring-opening dioxygenase LigB subunit [Periconia macrospinosa]|uniref:Putative aromatic ring-opening dioxygenase LigB subunit n=1 Tax=Periconia macrospinosa TaxID=97972 RepID=A0A2V1E5Q0_9PLEO|nr:putative aromatic ring-opening dioxygenase LigB subunit [Periconia macrospinosa]
MPNTHRPPVYFLGIGGPNFIGNTEHPAYQSLASIGQEITTYVKPKAVVVFSAHWQAGSTTLQINSAEHTDLVYDFYGFPDDYYQIKYPNKGSPEVARKVIERLREEGVRVEKVRRGLDHGVWVGFLAAFDPKKNPLNAPIVQVSLFGNEDLHAHYRVGKALESLRDDGVLIIGAGMAVHNLNDFRLSLMSGSTAPQKYASTFDDALKDAVESDPENRLERMVALLDRDDVRRAHPTLDHLLPIYVAAGASGLDNGHRIWTMPERSLNWASYRFGEVNQGT